MKKTMIIVAAITAGLMGCHSSSSKVSAEASTPNTESASDATGKAMINTALQVSEMDANVFSEISVKLEGSCYRNKFGLSEDECIRAIRSRKDICTQDTVEKYPGQLSNVETMQAATTNYVNCLFQQQR
jgi:hypothetical protein